MIRACGCRPCPDGARGWSGLDEILGAPLKQTAEPPQTLDLWHVLREIRDQRPEYGTCVGFGVSGAATVCARQAGNMDTERVSDLATYMQAMGISEGLDAPEDGTTIDAAIRGLSLGGYLLESECPYEPERRKDGFKLGKGQKALRRCGVQAHRLQTDSLDDFIRAVRTSIAAGKGVVGGWQIDDSVSLWTPDKGPWDGPESGDTDGHCMQILDFPQGDPRCANSWGPYVQDRGMITMTWRAARRAMSIWIIDFVPMPGGAQ